MNCDFVLISVCCVAKLDIIHLNVPTKQERLHSHMASVHFYLRSGLCCVRCHMCSMVPPNEATEEDQDEDDIEDVVTFSIKSLHILDGRSTKTISGFTNDQPEVIQYEDSKIETTDVDFTFADGKRKRQARKLGYLQRISHQTSRHFALSVWM